MTNSDQQCNLLQYRISYSLKKLYDVGLWCPCGKPFFVTDALSKKARVFLLDKLFQVGLIFAGKSRA